MAHALQRRWPVYGTGQGQRYGSHLQCVCAEEWQQHVEDDAEVEASLRSLPSADALVCATK